MESGFQDEEITYVRCNVLSIFRFKETSNEILPLKLTIIDQSIILKRLLKNTTYSCLGSVRKENFQKLLED